MTTGVNVNRSGFRKLQKCLSGKNCHAVVEGITGGQYICSKCDWPLLSFSCDMTGENVSRYCQFIMFRALVWVLFEQQGSIGLGEIYRRLGEVIERSD